MAAFSAGEIAVLVSTTVIEVGVDVPNAVIIVIENAERFGLAQLHQLRGRVGRGKFPSTCILLSDAQNEEAQRRLKVMCSTNDGFKIADEDLKLRGPGDFFGSRPARPAGAENCQPQRRYVSFSGGSGCGQAADGGGSRAGFAGPCASGRRGGAVILPGGSPRSQLRKSETRDA